MLAVILYKFVHFKHTCKLHLRPNKAIMHYFLPVIIINLEILTKGLTLNETFAKFNGNVLPGARQADGRRIIGGISATIEDFPYIISLQRNGRHFCGASLIKPNIVLTAAHCTPFKRNIFSVRAGSSIKEKGGQVAKVVDVCTHPKYNEKLTKYDYDVAVLKLNRSLELGPNVQLIDLQPLDEDVPVEAIGIIVGWGRLAFKGVAPTVLHKVEVPKTTEELCRSNEKVSAITDRMTCFGFAEGGKDACQMDSGGPLAVNNKQVGIVSWGYRCAVAEFPGVYTRIANSDIRNHINKCISQFN